jgi:hypothetical protein
MTKLSVPRRRQRRLPRGMQDNMTAPVPSRVPRIGHREMKKSLLWISALVRTKDYLPGPRFCAVQWVSANKDGVIDSIELYRFPVGTLDNLGVSQYLPGVPANAIQPVEPPHLGPSGFRITCRAIPSDRAVFHAAPHFRVQPRRRSSSPAGCRQTMLRFPAKSARSRPPTRLSPDSNTQDSMPPAETPPSAFPRA